MVDTPIKEDGLMKKYIRILLALISLVACLSLVACSASSDYEETYGDVTLDLRYEIDIDAEAESVGSVKNIIEAKCQSLGGYVEETDESYSSGECTYFMTSYRIPASKVSEFVAYVENSCDVNYKDSSTINAAQNNETAMIERETLEERRDLLNSMLYDNSLTLDERMRIVDQVGEISKKISEIDAAVEDSRYSVVYLSVSVKHVYVFVVHKAASRRH